MVEYTGNSFTIKDSYIFNGNTVNVLECRDSESATRGKCFRCGRVLRRHWWTVQTANNDAVYCDIGPECVRKLS